MVDIKQITSFLGTRSDKGLKITESEAIETIEEKSCEENIQKKDIQEEEKIDELELIAVVTAAICASMQVSKDEFIVRSIKRRKQQG